MLVFEVHCSVADFKNRLRRTRRDSLDAIKQMKLPEDDEKKEKDIVEKTLAQVLALSAAILAAPFDDLWLACAQYSSLIVWLST